MLFCLSRFMCAPRVYIEHQSYHFLFTSILKWNILIRIPRSSLWFNRRSNNWQFSFSTFCLLLLNFFFFNLMLIVNNRSSIRFKDRLKIQVLNDVYRLVIFRNDFLHFEDLVAESDEVLLHRPVNLRNLAN